MCPTFWSLHTETFFLTTPKLGLQMMTNNKSILNKELGTAIDGTPSKDLPEMCLRACTCVIVPVHACGQPAGMQVQLVIYTSFTGTQFTTKTNQINIGLKSPKGLSLRVARLLTKVYDC